MKMAIATMRMYFEAGWVDVVLPTATRARPLSDKKLAKRAKQSLYDFYMNVPCIQSAKMRDKMYRWLHRFFYGHHYRCSVTNRTW